MNRIAKLFPFFCLILMFFQNAFADEGTCGKNVRWETDGAETITFTGTRPGSPIIPTPTPYYPTTEPYYPTPVPYFGEAYWADDSGGSCTDVIRNLSGITTVIVSDANGKIIVSDGNRLFSNMYVKSMDLNGLDVSAATDMQWMFSQNRSLEELKLNSWDTSNVTNMSFLFMSCGKLKTLDISDWDTSNVTDMRVMFYGCSSLESPDIGRWNTSKVTNMDNMFEGCTTLKDPGVSNWDVSNVTDMQEMFSNCSSLESLDLNSWNTSSLTIMYRMFDWCSALKRLEIGSWNTSNVTNMGQAFRECTSLKKLDLSGWDTSNVTMAYSMLPVKVSSIVLGGNTLKHNIFSDDLYLRGKEDWVYEKPAEGLTDPLPAGTIMELEALTENYDPKSMAGTWTQTNAQITFDANDKDDGTSSREYQKIELNTPTELRENTFTREGYRFVGWNTSSMGYGKSYEDKEVVSTEVSFMLYAQWLTVEQEQESEVDPSDLDVDEEVKTSIKENSKVTGVNLDESDEGIQTFRKAALQTADEDKKAAVREADDMEILITVNLTPKEFKENELVSFEITPNATLITKKNNEKTAEINEIPVTNEMIDTSKDIIVTIYTGFQPEQIVHRDKDGCVIEVFTKDQYRWDGEIGTAAVTIHRFSTLTAMADALKAIVRFDKNHAEAEGSMEPQAFTYGVRQTLTANAFSLAGYQFTGWNTAADGTGTSFADRAEISSLMEDITLFAQWKINEEPPHRPSIPFFPIDCQDCMLPATGFPSDHALALSARPTWLSYDSLGLRLQIPRFDVETELVQIPQNGNSWIVEWLGNRAGILEGSALPGTGISLIAAHNTLNDTEYGPFALLSQLEEKDRILVTNEDSLLLYQVYDNELIGPSDFAAIRTIAEQKPGSLVLITCENESLEGGYLNRRVIFAEPM